MRRDRIRTAVAVAAVVAAGAATVLLMRTPGSGEAAAIRRTWPLPSVSPPPAGAVEVAAAGDICPPRPEPCAPTADLVERLDPDAVLVLGDNQYESGTLEEYRASYDRTWGRFLPITHPVAGNHEWRTGGAAGYLEYFDRTTTWSTFSLGRWRLYALDGTCEENGGCAPGDPQYEWLAGELDTRTDRCILGYWHQPRLSSGTEHGSDEQVAPLWDLLESAGGDLVLNGHEHNYERFAPQDGRGRPDASGMVEIVVGTGGTTRAYPFGDPVANSIVRLGGSGVLELSLFDGGWVARFVRPDGTVDDQASGSC
jgi:hypothetical protein